jgi:hypothetical protein
MKQMVFNTTVTDDDRDNVGAYVRSSDGTLITHTTENSNERLDVDAAIRGSNGDAITVTGGALDVNLASGTITINEADIFAEDSAHTTGDSGSFVLAVRQDTLAASTSADGDYAAFKVDGVGSLYVTDSGATALLTSIDSDIGNIAADTAALVVDLAAIEVEQLAQGTTLDSILAVNGTIRANTSSIDATLTGLSKSEDAAHASGDAGIMSLAVRNDTLAALAGADGDYAPLQVNADGALYVDVGTISVDDAALANTDFSTTQTSITTTSGSVASALPNRKYILIRNEGTKKMFIGKTTATTAGFPISPGETLMLRAGAAIDFKAVTSSSTADARTLQLS